MPRRYLATCLMSVTALQACMPPPKLGAPKESYSPATFRVKITDTEETVAGAAVTLPFFAAERVQPMLGRAIVEPDLAKASHGVAILSHRFWTERMQSSPTAIGTQILVDGRPYTIVGVMPAAFEPDGAGLLWIAKRPS